MTDLSRFCGQECPPTGKVFTNMLKVTFRLSFNELIYRVFSGGMTGIWRGT